MKDGSPGLLRSLFDGYRRLLKAPEVEETLDLVLYRPLAYLSVRLVAATPITPNQITFLSILFGLVAGWLLGHGTAEFLRWGALCVLIFNVLDCADGMLARWRGASCPLGYIWDGLAGYIGTSAIILGLGQAVAVRHNNPLFWWSVTVAAGISMAWWCAIVDGMRLEWLRRVHGKRQHRAEEVAELIETAETWRREGKNRGGRVLISAYAFYVKLWEGRASRDTAETAEDHLPATLWASANRPILRLAVATGSTMQLTAMIAAAAINRPEWVLWGAIVAGNLWGAAVLVARLAVRQRLLAQSLEGA